MSTPRNIAAAAIGLLVAQGPDVASAGGLYGNASGSAQLNNRYQNISEQQLLDIVKYSGCTADGLVNTESGIEYDQTPNSLGRLTLFDAYVAGLDRSNCIYINRALEIWNSPPDFTAVASNVAALTEISSRGYVLGVNMAESLDKSGVYYYPDESRDFDFDAMCGDFVKPEDPRLCYGSFSSPEFRKYVKYVMKQSIGLGFQVFLFGNLGITEPFGTAQSSEALTLFREMKAYAAARNSTIVVGAQFPSGYGGKVYLDQFDFIQGAIYMNRDGSIPGVAKVDIPGAPDRLWFHPELYDLSKLVIEYDWFGSELDDTTKLARLSLDDDLAATRVLEHVQYFRSRKIGFWLPFRQPTAFPPWVYTPLDQVLYHNSYDYRTSYDDEQILAAQPLRAGTALETGRFYRVGNGSLVQQGDGNLCFYGPVNWCSMRMGSRATFTPQGNLVQYDAAGNLLWESGTSGRGLVLGAPDGIFSILTDASPGAEVIWSVYRGLVTPIKIARGALAPNQGYNFGSVVMLQQGDGNLCFYGSAASTCTMKYGRPDHSTVFTASGDLVQYDGDGRVLWQSGTAGRGASLGVVAGKVAILDPRGQVVWSY